MRIVVSACLLGENCKYSGGNNENKAVLNFEKTMSLYRSVRKYWADCLCRECRQRS